MKGFKNIGVYAIGRYTRQTESEISDAVPSPSDFDRSRGSIRTFNDNKYFENLDLREVYLYSDLVSLPGGDGYLSVGRQQIIWGESDGFRLADVVNPLDLSWHYFLESFEDIRTKQLAQARNRVLKGGGRGLGRLFRPQQIDEPLHRNDPAGLQKEDDEEPALPLTAKRDRTALVRDLERAEDAEFQHVEAFVTRAAPGS